MRPPLWLSWSEYCLPLTRPTTAAGELERRGLIVSIGRGLGEAAPLPGLHEESVESLVGLLSQLDLDFDGDGDARTLLPALNAAPGFAELPPSLRFGIESAFVDREASRRELSREDYLWPDREAQAPKSVGLFAGTPDQAAAQLRAGDFAPYAGVKIKVGRGHFDSDVRVIETFRRCLPDAEIRLDANRSLDRAAMDELCRAVAGLDVAFVEEPFADPADLEKYVAEGEGLPVALDESLVAAVRAGRMPPAGPNVAAWVIKPSCLGLWTSLQLIETAAPIATIVSSSFESDLGTGMLRALAAGSPAHPGLGTDRWFVGPMGGDHMTAWRISPASVPGIVELLRRDPDADFLVTPDGTLSRGEAARRIEERACGMTPRGAPGVAVVPLELQPTVDAVIELLAVLEAGCAAAPLNLREPEERRAELRGQLATAAAPKPGLLVRTSGTTSAGRWALLEWTALLHGAERAAHPLEFGVGDCWLMNLPLWHVGGLGPIWRALIGGGALALPGAKFTHVSLVATQLRRLLEGELPPEYADCRGILLGGGPCPPELLAEARDRGLQAQNSYGMTETGSLCVLDGRAIETCELEISKDDEVLVRGPALFSGYFDPETGALREPFDAAGWFATGDLGAFDEGGRLRIVGRRDNQFISGGENIQPEEIEAALLSLDGVGQAVVVGVPDEEFGMRPVAFTDSERADLAEALAPLLPRYMIPDRFLALPTDDGGGIKPSRRELARRAARR